MSNVIFQIVTYIVMAAGVALAGMLIPALKKWAAVAETELRNNNHALAADIIHETVFAMEQTIQGEKMGAIRYSQALDTIKQEFLKNKIHMTDEQIDTIIQAAVYAINHADTVLELPEETTED